MFRPPEPEPPLRVSLLPGEFRVTREPLVLTTLLGSCVAVCLFDPGIGAAGMNHFLLPVQGVSEPKPFGVSPSGRYGIGAMELLINGLLKLGANKARLRAKVFGGASLLSLPQEVPGQTIGKGNVRFVREFLALEGIPIEAEDLGGDRGRVIHFHSDTFVVWRRYIRNTVLEREVSEREAQVWKSQVSRRGGEGDVTLFS